MCVSCSSHVKQGIWDICKFYSVMLLLLVGNRWSILVCTDSSHDGEGVLFNTAVLKLDKRHHLVDVQRTVGNPKSMTFLYIICFSLAFLWDIALNTHYFVAQIHANVHNYLKFQNWHFLRAIWKFTKCGIVIICAHDCLQHSANGTDLQWFVCPNSLLSSTQ